MSVTSSSERVMMISGLKGSLLMMVGSWSVTWTFEQGVALSRCSLVRK